MMNREPADASPDLAQLAAHREAPLWAALCAWVPGTGHCRNRPCSRACLFHERRAAEAERIVWARRRRRAGRRGGGALPPR